MAVGNLAFYYTLYGTEWFQDSIDVTVNLESYRL